MSYVEISAVIHRGILVDIVDSLFEVLNAEVGKYVEYVSSAWVEFDADNQILFQYGRASNGYMFSEFFNNQLEAIR